MAEEQTITIEVNGQELKARPGQMLIEVTDEAGIEIPRFCYHEKLSVSANCRMCLVEVEKVPRPLPACATPVNDGMKVMTRSPMALAAQKGTMEFLLINHPLDCPICDQGGECELQDVAVGYGSDVSRYVEGKRVVAQENIGPLIATEFTRCIHCTRCVRFGAEIAGVREMGAPGRGEHMHISTYVEKSVDSELSGNIIDVCPVGSLTSKPFRFQARAWELQQRNTIAPHDSLGSNINLHIRRDQVMRVHPRDNDAVNECWISDRDRFSYEALNGDQRLTQPMIRKGDSWLTTDWESALEAAANGLKAAKGVGDRIAAFVSPSSTLEEMHLARKLMQGMGSDQIDCRLRQADFRGGEPAFPWLGMSVADLEKINGALIVGSNIRKEHPLLAHRVRKAALEGAKVSFINPMLLDMNYVASQAVVTPPQMVATLAGIAKAVGAKHTMASRAKPSEQQRAIAEELKAADNAVVLLGNMAAAHPDYSLLRSLANAIASATGAKLGYMLEAANSVGARLVGAAGSDSVNTVAMLQAQPKGVLLMGVEPDKDFVDGAVATEAMKNAEFVVALASFRSASLTEVADVILPMAAFTETSGTYVNVEGRWQSFSGAVSPAGDSRPAWKILRVLGNLTDCDGFDQVSSDEVLAEIRESVGDAVPDNSADYLDKGDKQLTARLSRIGDVSLYAADMLVRNAPALQKTKDAIKAAAYMHPEQAGKSGLEAGGQVKVNGSTVLAVELDDHIPVGTVRIPAALNETSALGAQFAKVTLEKA